MMQADDELLRGLLLLGPTGSGKTPLGDCIEARGWLGCRCVHFDFGEQLRQVAAGIVRPEGLSAADRAFVVEVLESGALLEDEKFYIAECILRAFIRRKGFGEGDCAVLNGLPRHVGQAVRVDRTVRMEWVLDLQCAPEVVHRRIRTDAGGDRTGRVDDEAELVVRKLEIFRARTAPLLDYYRAQGTRVVEVVVEEGTQPVDIWNRFHV